jgi:alpha-D-ribose 1-methylphosphonate 5-triphosphate diphosphatase
MSTHVIVSRRVLMPDGELADASLTIADGIVAGVDATFTGRGRFWDARAMLVLPGIIDLHGDAFERQVMPRPGVRFPLDLALHETDRQMVANGITTAFHAATCSFEPGLRSRETILDLLDALERVRATLACDTRLHLRHEAYNVDAVDEICGWIARGRVDLLAFNDHTPPMLAKIGNLKALGRYTERTGMDPAALGALLHRVKERADEVPGATRRLAAAARQAGLPLASHDDETPAMRAAFRGLGCTISEFPKTAETAADAHQHGEAVILGAPNVVRGGSHLDGVGAADMVERGLCDVLSSDYYYPALLQAALKLARDGKTDLGRAWALVSANPARACGLVDRGEFSPGRRADIVIVDDSNPQLPRVVTTFVAGRPVFVGGRFASLTA